MFFYILYYKFENILPADRWEFFWGDNMKKVAIIRCRQTEEVCGSTMDFKIAAEGKGSFEQFGPCEVVGVVSCGGCPGKLAIGRAKMLIRHGAEVIAFASCITKGTPFGFPCPNRELMLETVKKTVGEKAIVLDYTH